MQNVCDFKDIRSMLRAMHAQSLSERGKYVPPPTHTHSQRDSSHEPIPTPPHRSILTQVKLLRLLQYFPPPQGTAATRSLHDMLQTIFAGAGDLPRHTIHTAPGPRYRPLPCVHP